MLTMFERFTKEAREVVSAAVEQTFAMGHDAVGTQHLLLGLLTPNGGAGYQVLQGAGLQADQVGEIVRRRTPVNGVLTHEDAESLRTIGIDLDVVLERLAESFGPGAVPQAQPRRRRARLSRTVKKSLQLALREAIWLKAGAIGSEHILLGLLRCEDSEINAILAEVGVSSGDLRTATILMISHAA